MVTKITISLQLTQHSPHCGHLTVVLTFLGNEWLPLLFYKTMVKRWPPEVWRGFFWKVVWRSFSWYKNKEILADLRQMRNNQSEKQRLGGRNAMKWDVQVLSSNFKWETEVPWCVPLWCGKRRVGHFWVRGGKFWWISELWGTVRGATLTKPSGWAQNYPPIWSSLIAISLQLIAIWKMVPTSHTN